MWGPTGRGSNVRYGEPGDEPDVELLCLSDRKIELRVFDPTGKSERNRVKQVRLVGLGAVQAEEIDLVPIDRLVITMFLDGGSLALTALLLDQDFEVLFPGARLPVRGAGASARVRDLLQSCLAGQPDGAPSSSPLPAPVPAAPAAGAPAPEGPAGSAARSAVDTIHAGRCLELKVDGRDRPCNGDMRLKDDGGGTVDIITGYGGERGAAMTAVDFEMRQTADLENAYGYAFRVSALRLMTFDAPETRTVWAATGLCQMVKPNPVKVGASAVQQDIVVMCSAVPSDGRAPVKRIDWKFVF
ncbi:hypothetical protein HNR00_004766 [Methylorubrum rhodinum]|uniref:Uncharacterized protein n=1 Tax=Methylorubrum rhodinum TaxID=29428 RepID=A0A840ZQZ1_9HYPH|nr:hypothetical protein [Methylorubrum rhodinum]MBB5760026.1 hypothetical protein [Methylorubrum rhodinum]